jgi:hypothetical protein
MINKKNIKSRKTQVTIFVIVALLIVIAMVLIFTFYKHPLKISGIKPLENPAEYFKSCLSEKAEKIIDELMLRGGFKEEKSMAYKNFNATYLCYTNYNNEVCMNEHPVLKKEIETEIKKELMKDVEGCFKKLKNELRNNNYKEEDLKIDVYIAPKRISLEIKKKISFSASGVSQSHENFGFYVDSPGWNFIKLASEILNQEVDCDCENEVCRADTLELNLENRNYEIENPVFDDNLGKIYVVREILTGKEFRFAVKNCVNGVW